MFDGEKGSGLFEGLPQEMRVAFMQNKELISRRELEGKIIISIAQQQGHNLPETTPGQKMEGGMPSQRESPLILLLNSQNSK